jgi:UTP--glucose-1-phosphate uridylyltransferase
VLDVVEKPKPEDAKSNLAVIGRYVFTPGIFDALTRITPGVGGELQLTDAIELLIQSEPVFGRVFAHGRYDIGQKLDFLRANIELALERPDLGPELADYLRGLVRDRLS